MQVVGYTPNYWIVRNSWNTDWGVEGYIYLQFGKNTCGLGDVVTFADEDGVALRGGHHCNQPLMRKLGLTSTTRASFYVYNTEQEIDVLVASLRRIQKFFGAS